MYRRLPAVIATAAVIATTLIGATTAIAATPLPAHVFAPYFETWTTDSIATTGQQSGVGYFTLAFLETTSKTSCTLAWNGVKTQSVSATPTPFLADIAALRSGTGGGDVIPSFGGWSADQGGTEIGDSCSDPAAIATAYEQVVTTYEVSRLDMDIEGRSLTKSAGIDRRNKAIKLLQDWAGAHGRTVQVSYTLPTSRNGLEASGLAVLQNAVANGVRIDAVNPMVFDYYDRAGTDMGDSAISALRGLNTQLQGLLPGKTTAQLWALEGATIMNGLDDYPRKTESTSVQDAQQLLAFANAPTPTSGATKMNNLSMWAIQRDNGGCPGSTGANNCSGIVQNTWDFSHALAAFTGP
jgi:glycosyl hydrolase family 18 (putative chitinase)